MAEWTHLTAPLPEGVTVETHGSGVPLVLIAGNGGGTGFWSGLAPFLPQCQLIAFDYRDAPSYDGAGALFETAPRKAADLPEILDALDLGQAIILGHSTGAQAAIRFAAAHAERTRHLVVSGGYAAPHPFITKSMGLRKEILRTMGPEAFMLDSLYRAIPPAQLFAQMEEKGAEGLLAFREAPDVALESARIDQIIAGDVSDLLPKIAVPTTVIHARNDSVFPFALGTALAAAIDGASLAPLDEGSHLAPMLAPDVYASALGEALSL